MTAPKPITLARAADEYLDTLATDSTKRTYGAALKAMRARFADDAHLDRLTPEDVAAWIQAQWGRQSSGTFNVRLRAVRSAAAWWAKRGWIPPGLVDGVENRKSRAVLAAEVLTPDEVEAIMTRALGYGAASGIRNKALIMLLYKSGLRLSEALGIRPGDIDFGSHSIRLLVTKSGQPQTRGFHPSADDALYRWLDVRRELGFNGRQPVFCSIRRNKGARLSREYVAEMLNASANEAGVGKRVHPHGFRHTFAAEMEAAGVPVSTIQQLLGHLELSSTSKYLGSLTNRQAIEALSKLKVPGYGEDETPVIREAGVNPDLEAIRNILADPDAAAILAGLAGTAVRRAERKRQPRSRQDPAVTSARELARAKAIASGELNTAMTAAREQREAGMTREQAMTAARELHALGASTREIGQAVGKAHGTVSMWLREEKQ